MTVIAGVSVAGIAVIAIGIGAWHGLPRLMPEFTMRYSPFGDPVIRSAVYGGLEQRFKTKVECDSAKWIPFVIERMTNSADRRVRALAAEIVNQESGLKLIVENDVFHETIVIGLADEEETVRFYAAAALGNLRYSAARERLELAMLDGSPRVRDTAVWALGKIADQRSIPALLFHLDDKEEDVRGTIIDALVSIAQKHISAEEKLEVTLRIEALQKDVSAHVKGRAKVALRLLLSAPENGSPVGKE